MYTSFKVVIMLNAIHGEEEATKNARQRHSVLTATNLRVAARDWIGASSTRVHRSETTGLQTEWLLPQMCPPPASPDSTTSHSSNERFVTCPDARDLLSDADADLIAVTSLSFSFFF